MNLKIAENWWKPERTDRLQPMDWVKVIALGGAADGAVSYAFYQSWILYGILLVPACILASVWYRQHRQEQRSQKLEIQFKEMIQSLSAALSAGYSVENALVVCHKEMTMMYGAGEVIVTELDHMISQVNMNRSVETVMYEFASRSGLEEAQNFAYIFAIAKRSGGRLVSIINHTVRIMQDRFQVKEEIATLTASRRFEQRIMSLMPFCIILYVDVASPGFFDSLYTTIAGRIVMSGCLAVYGLSCYLSHRILDIKVG